VAVQSNYAKYKNFVDGTILHGQNGFGQNLNDDLERAIADEIDGILNGLVGNGVIGSSSWLVIAGSGLSVTVTPGVGVIVGQVVRSSGTLSVPALPANTANVLIYVEATSGWIPGFAAWPGIVGFSTTTVTSGQMLIATVATDGSAVIAVTDGRRLLTPIGSLNDQAASRARSAAAGVM